MPHDNHVIDGVNKDVEPLNTRFHARDAYLHMARNWEDPNPDPVVTVHDGVRVVRDDLLVGSKVRGGDCLVSSLPEEIEELVYVQPRTGLAGVSIIDVARRHGKIVTLFMPASKAVSVHQACCIERGATPKFRRIAAMPNLNKFAREYADESPSRFFIPLGLKHPMVTAGIVKVAARIPAPDLVYTATSTGVLTRALQIAWPDAEFVSVCVSRNMKAGELGVADPISHPLAFTACPKPETLPPFPTVPTYDGKVWPYVPKNSDRDVLFWNVGVDPVLEDHTIVERTDSAREWREVRD